MVEVSLYTDTQQRFDFNLKIKLKRCDGIAFPFDSFVIFLWRRWVSGQS